MNESLDVKKKYYQTVRPIPGEVGEGVENQKIGLRELFDGVKEIVLDEIKIRREKRAAKLVDSGWDN